jgi:hypothetical protein
MELGVKSQSTYLSKKAIGFIILAIIIPTLLINTNIANANNTDTYGYKIYGTNVFGWRVFEFGITLTIVYRSNLTIQDAVPGAQWTSSNGERFADGVISCIWGASCSTTVKNMIVQSDMVKRELQWRYRAPLFISADGEIRLNIYRYDNSRNLAVGGYTWSGTYFDWSQFFNMLQGLIEIIKSII